MPVINAIFADFDSDSDSDLTAAAEAIGGKIFGESVEKLSRDFLIHAASFITFLFSSVLIVNSFLCLTEVMHKLI